MRKSFSHGYSTEFGHLFQSSSDRWRRLQNSSKSTSSWNHSRQFYVVSGRFFRKVRHEAAQEMRGGPSPPAYRCRLQTTLSCAGKEPVWWALRKRHDIDRVRYEPERWVQTNHWWGVEKKIDDIKTGGFPNARKSPEDNLFTVWIVFGIKVAWIWFRLLCGTREAVVPMLREKPKWRPHEDESTDAGHSGGATRSSDEGSVMEPEWTGLEHHGIPDYYDRKYSEM
jgi:hypothetical protein